ncbi:nicotinate-nucleotide adenylyltransferase [Oxalobacteraceae bacterium GrIS 2.11]
MADLLNPTQVRIIPSGWSWQKLPFHVSAEHRLAMLSLAFTELASTNSLVIDQQEMQRALTGTPSYSVDTLTQLRNEFGPSASMVFVIGTDQLLHLPSWNNWEHLFDLAHIAVVSRPGFALDELDSLVAREFKQRAGTITQLRQQASGHTYLCEELAIDISSTELRDRLQADAMPPAVLKYVQEHHLY